MPANCEYCSVTNIQFIRLTSNFDELLQYLCDHGVLAHAKCPITGECLKMNDMRYRCQKIHTVNRKRKTCNYEVSLRENSFFGKSKWCIEKICLFVVLWLKDPPRQDYICKELSCTAEAVVNWSSNCREVLEEWSYNISSTEKLGGPGEVVEIDEAKIGKRKYNCGRIVEGQWVFGGILRSDTTKIFIVPVECRNASTLLEIIKHKIKSGTTIMSDCWKAYNCLSDEGFQHYTVNHSIHFVDPDTKAHTQNIERAWKEVRVKVPRYGRRKYHFWGYLAEYMFKRAYPDHRDRLHHFFIEAGKLYPSFSSK